MTSLTLCLIARDEERHLDACLASVRGIVDRIVVVDTGSTDRTVEIARQHGAEVVEHAWQDDFAAARNAALGRVDGGYILVLDADERLAAGAGPALRAAVEAGELDCGLLPLHNADSVDAPADDVLSGACRLGEPVLLGRLLRHTTDLRWQGRVHEHLTEWSSRHPRRAPLEAAIVHLGAVPELRAELGKDARNLALLERRHADEPGSPSVAAYFAQELVRTGELPRARQIAARAWDAARKLEGEPGRLGRVHAASIHALLCIEALELDAAAAVLEECLAHGCAHPNLDFLIGRVAEARAAETAGPMRAAELENAARAYAAALAARGVNQPIECLNGATGHAAATRLGHVLLGLDDPQSALAHFDTALADRSPHVEARLGRVEALLQLERGAEALDELQPLLHPDLPDGWLLGLWAAALFGDGATATAMREQLERALEGREFLAPHRRAIADEFCRLLAA